MGKDTGFLDIERRDPGYRSVDERLKDFRAVENMPDEDDIYDQAARCMDCGIPFCHGFGCPLKNVIPEFNDLVYQGDWARALDILLSTSCFPEFTGRICPAPCETACVDGINGEPVTIRQIELAIIEKAFEKGLMKPEPPAFYHDKRVAVIGAGPAGLAAALKINRAGYHVTVYDEAEKPGGLLRYGIPDFKLEKTIVERQIGRAHV
jgi:glutamate synthase (NADPH/NADH) small chain